MSLPSCLHVCAVVAIVAVAITPARATTLAQTDLETMAREADAVVQAVVERTGTQMAYNASIAPWSVTQLRVLRWWKRSDGQRIWIRDQGAVWANGGRPVIGAAVYSPGEEVIAFLRKDDGGYFRTLNLAAGKLLVLRDGAEPVVEQNLEDVSVLQPALAEPASSIVQGRRRVLAPLSEVLSQLTRLSGTGL